jgi:hypothetical protein
MTPVAIVGQAWRTPLGRSIDEVVARIRAGDRAAIASPRAAGYACSTVAPIAEEPAKSRQSRFLRRMGLFGLEVAKEAFASTKLDAHPDRIGLFAGVGGLRAHWDDMLAGLEQQSVDGENAWERGLRDVHPYWMLRHLSNNVHALASVDLALRGEGATFGGATGGAQAIAAAARALEDGAIDAALIVAYDSLLEPETLVELGAKQVAFVPGEAAGALVVVRTADAPASLRVAAADGGDGERDEPSPAAIDRVMRAVNAGSPDTSITDALGQLGAATSVIQTIALGAMLPPDSVAFGVSTGAPGLVAAVRVERPG